MKISLIKYITFFFFILSIGSIASGYFLDETYSQKLIGFGVIGLFLIVFPLFSYYRWKDRNLKDYMITKESLDKMREYKEGKDV
ncbi:hypothetical protein OS188_10840 [Xanthomarina sp. F1114]|uniref:hypothetical protein n=1 Tax=Xanthomarina sp. F1114 TaxID=2996019 RepID=UPI00225DE135|nr:hypothetical protein [Xanthomarina sp. F1114]MCX7548447.1 hypothetical protein [Xanthomarina sp. F1114]